MDIIKKNFSIKIIFIFFVCVYLGVLIGIFYLEKQNEKKIKSVDFEQLKSIVLPENGYTLPIKWNDLSKKMIEQGVIDSNKLSDIYKSRSGLSEELNKLLSSNSNEQIVINQNNSAIWLNLLWGLGLSNKNSILENGPMMKNGDASKFASTGGWTIAVGKAMDHYSKHGFVILDDKQQKLVENISKNIYRPCCGNSTYFPDCNHGMAMLGLIELMASQNINEKDIYDAALKVNSYWFPDTYLAIAKYFQDQGKSWKNVSAKEILGIRYSSISGYQEIRSKVTLPITTPAGCNI